jgi:hypothetical protein
MAVPTQGVQGVEGHLRRQLAGNDLPTKGRRHFGRHQRGCEPLDRLPQQRCRLLGARFGDDPSDRHGCNREPYDEAGRQPQASRSSRMIRALSSAGRPGLAATRIANARRMKTSRSASTEEHNVRLNSSSKEIPFCLARAFSIEPHRHPGCGPSARPSRSPPFATARQDSDDPPGGKAVRRWLGPRLHNGLPNRRQGL